MSRNFFKNSNLNFEDSGDSRILKDEFFKRADKKHSRNSIIGVVKLVEEIYYEDLEKRRRKLKTLLDAEDSQLHCELIKKSQTDAVNDKIKKLDSIKSFQMEKQRETEEFLKMKKMQALIENDDDVRLSLRKNLLNETKMTQLLQIEEKQKRKQREREEECLWLKVRQKIEEEQEKRQRYEDHLKKMVLKKEQMELLAQKEEFEKRKMQKKFLTAEEKLSDEANKKAELEEIEKERLLREEKKKKQAELLRAQLEESLKEKQKRAAEEKEYEDQFNEILRRQIEHEENLMKAKMSDLKLTILRYLEYCNEIKKERDLQQKQDEKILEEYRKKTECKELQMRNAVKEKKAQEAKKAHDELLQQISENHERRLQQCQEEFEKEANERKLHETKLQQEQKDFESKRHEFIMNYRRQLQEQTEEMKKLNIERKKQFQEDIRRASEEEEFRSKLAQKIIKEKLDFLPTHPNWSLINCSCIEN